MPKRVGSSDVKTTSSMERRGRNPPLFKARIASSPSEHSHNAVIFSGVGNGIDVRTRCDGRCRVLVADPTGKRIADRILAKDQARLFAFCPQPARALRSVAVKTIRVTAGGLASEIRAMLVNLGLQPPLIDSQFHACGPARGCRFASL